MMTPPTFLLAEHMDSIVMLLPPFAAPNQIPASIFSLAQSFAQDLPVLIVLPDLNEGKFQFTDSGFKNIQIVHLFNEYGPGQSGLINRALLSVHAIKPLLWIQNPLFENFIIHRYAPLKVYYAREDSPNLEKISSVLSHTDLIVTDSQSILDIFQRNPLFQESQKIYMIDETMKHFQELINLFGKLLQTSKKNIDPLNILVLYDQRALSDPAIKKHLEGNSQYSSHCVFYANVAFGQECRIHLSHFEVIVFHFSINVLDRASLSQSFSNAIKRFCGYKLLFLPQPCDYSEPFLQWIKENGINALVSFHATVSPDSSLDYLNLSSFDGADDDANDQSKKIQQLDSFLSLKVKKSNQENLSDDFLEITPGCFYNDLKGVAYPIIPCQPNSIPEENSNVDIYWNFHTVAAKRFKTEEESLQFLQWRAQQYPLFNEFMELYGNHENEVILDYGCGPGNDLIGFLLFSHAQRVIGMDVSLRALTLAATRLALHHIAPERVSLFLASDKTVTIPLANDSVDYIYSGGVLHHTSNPVEILKEFFRILKPGQSVCIMVYNKNSLWYHLHTAYYRMIILNQFTGLSMDEAFSRNTDGEYCPIARCYKPEDFIALCQEAGFHVNYCGGYLSQVELEEMANYYQQALVDSRLPREHQQFLQHIKLDNHGFPLYEDKYAGIGGVYHLKKILL